MEQSTKIIEVKKKIVLYDELKRQADVIESILSEIEDSDASSVLISINNLSSFSLGTSRAKSMLEFRLNQIVTRMSEIEEEV